MPGNCRDQQRSTRLKLRPHCVNAGARSGTCTGRLVPPCYWTYRRPRANWSRGHVRGVCRIWCRSPPFGHAECPDWRNARFVHSARKHQPYLAFGHHQDPQTGSAIEPPAAGVPFVKFKDRYLGINLGIYLFLCYLSEAL